MSHMGSSPQSRTRTKRGNALGWLFFVGIFLSFALLGFSSAGTQADEAALLKQNGTLVTAVVAEVRADDEDHDYYTRYRYVDENGKVYTGSTGQSYGSYDSAAAHLGEEIDIYIDAHGNSVRADYPVQKDAFEIVCIVIEILLCCIVGAMALLIVSMFVSRSNAKARGETLEPMPWKSAAGLVAMFACVGLMLYGIFSGRTWLFFTMLGVLAGGSFLVALCTVIMVAKGIKKPSNASEEIEREREQIDRINTTTHFENKTAMAEYQIRHIQRAAKADKGKGKTPTILLLVWLLGSFVGIMVFAAFGLWIGSVVCIVCFAGTIIGAIVTVAVLQRLALSPKNFNADRTYTGTVTDCHVSSSTSSGNRYRKRLRSVTYKVYLIVEGEEKVAYSHIFLAEGETVPVHLHKNPKKNTVRITDEFTERNVYKEGALDVLTAEYERLHANVEDEDDEIEDLEDEERDDEEPWKDEDGWPDDEGDSDDAENG